MPSVMIIGASRGIGLGFVRAYAAADGWQVHATTRTPDKPGALGEVEGDVTIHELDVIDAGQIHGLARALDDTAVDVLIHSAGVYGRNMGRDLVLAVNAEAPFQVIAALTPALDRGTQKKIAILSSSMGARNGGPTPTDAYGASKAALNDRYRELEASWRAHGFKSVILHPGWVRTHMGGAGAPLPVEDSVRGMRQVIGTMRADDCGKFLDWQGRELSW